jgi:hypothetical protein
MNMPSGCCLADIIWIESDESPGFFVCSKCHEVQEMCQFSTKFDSSHV